MQENFCLTFSKKKNITVIKSLKIGEISIGIYGGKNERKFLFDFFQKGKYSTFKRVAD